MIVPADTVTIAISTQSSNDDTSQASAESNERLNVTLEFLMDAGVTKDDIDISSNRYSGVSRLVNSGKVCQTVNNSTTCEYTGYNKTTVTTSVMVRLKGVDSEGIESVIKAARESGAEANVLSYELSDEAGARDEAQERAREDARKKAEAYARSYEMSIGKVTNIWVCDDPASCMIDPFGGIMSFGLGMMQPYYTQPSEPGMVEIVEAVIVTYELTG